MRLNSSFMVFFSLKIGNFLSGFSAAMSGSHVVLIFIAALAFFAGDYRAAAQVSPVASFEENFNSIDESVWQIATWAEHGGQTGRERCYAQNGFLNLVFINDSGTYLSSAIQTRAEFGYGRWEARLKPSSVPGVLDSFYTIDWIADEGASQTQQEIDIEFLTYTFADDAGKVHYAVHANDSGSFETNPDIPVEFNPSDDFHVWGFEITPTHISWFVDGETIQTYTYADPCPFIDKLYQLKLNTWSSTHWINGPPAPGVACIYQIDWIKFYPYDPDGTTTTTAPPSSTTTTAGPSSTTHHNPANSCRAVPGPKCPGQRQSKP